MSNVGQSQKNCASSPLVKWLHDEPAGPSLHLFSPSAQVMAPGDHGYFVLLSCDLISAVQRCMERVPTKVQYCLGFSYPSNSRTNGLQSLSFPCCENNPPQALMGTCVFHRRLSLPLLFQLLDFSGRPSLLD